MENKQKPSCEYGAKCYRKNPQHFKKFSHPKELPNGMKLRSESKSPDSKKPKLEKTEKDSKPKYKQSTLQFKKDNGSSSQVVPNPEKLEVTLNKDEDGKNLDESNNTTQESASPKCDDKGIISESEDENSDIEDVQSTSWVFIKRDSDTTATKSTTDDLEGKSVEEIIKILFLVEMPNDFYSFYEFCKSIDNNDPLNALKICQLKLVGPYDILNGKRNYPADKKLALCHWRFFYDPPECQTVLASPSGFHIGYWRDDPKMPPVFMASNDQNKDCKFVIEAENVFEFVYHYLYDYLKTCDPFIKVKITKLQSTLKDWAEKNKFNLEKNNTKILAKRKKKACSATFHGAFISVPVESSTDVGYRPLLKSNASLKKICKNIMAADDPKEREALWEDIDQLVRFANIANDESDFGNSLELGIDLFCMGSPIFHDVVEYLLTTAYDLLKRPEFGEIIRVHLKNRRKGNDMSIF